MLGLLLGITLLGPVGFVFCIIELLIADYRLTLELLTYLFIMLTGGGFLYTLFYLFRLSFDKLLSLLGSPVIVWDI
jgi:hypothetical protein